MTSDGVIAKRAKAARENAGVSQRDLAWAMRRHGWAQGTVSRFEAGDRPLRLVEAVDLANHLGTTIDALTGDAAPTNASARRELLSLQRQIEARLERLT